MTNLQSLGLPVGMSGGPVPGVPIGAIIMSIQALYERTTAPVYTGNAEFNIPVGFLLCDGTWYHMAEYPELYDVMFAALHPRTETGLAENFALVSTYIDEDLHTFQVPDMLSRMGVGRGDTLGAEDYYAWSFDGAAEADRDIAVHTHGSAAAHDHVNGSLVSGTYTHTQRTDSPTTGVTQRLTTAAGHDHGALTGDTGTRSTGATDNITKAAGLAQLGVSYLIRAY